MSRRTNRAGALIAIVLLGMLGCGGDDSEDGADAPDSAHDEPAAESPSVDFRFRPGACQSNVSTFQCFGRQTDDWFTTVEDPETVLAGITEAIRDGTFGIDIETTDDPDEFVSCLESRSARSVCNYMLASSVPCVGPPGGVADVIGHFSTEAGIAWRVIDGDEASAVVDLICEMRRKLRNDTHDDMGSADESERSTRRINELADQPDAQRWLESDEGHRFVANLNSLANVDTPALRALPTRLCGIRFLRWPC